tara:strand:+ start:9462 stop:9827 length:366 start_codon:yes stop_codon:yes gene_type:complete
MIKKEEALKIKTGFTPYPMSYLLSTNKYFETGVEDKDLDFSNTDEPIFDHYQYVIEAGEGCDFKKGDKLLLDLEQFLQRRENPNNRAEVLQTLEFSTVEIEDVNYIMVDASRRFIKGKMED